MRGGDLSAYLPKTLVKDPLNNGAPFPNNQIPVNRISPLSAAVLNYFYPMPNYGAPGAIANNYQTNFPTPITSNQGDMRVDHNITPNQTAFARLTYKEKETFSAPSGSVNLGGGDAIERDYAISGAYNYIITRSLINEARVGYTGSNSGTKLWLHCKRHPAGTELTTCGTATAGSRLP